MRFFSLFFLWGLCLAPLQAKWARWEDSPATILEDELEIEVDESGQTKTIQRRRIRINNDTGREIFGTFKLNYTPELTKVEVLEAATENKKKIVQVPPHLIEKAPFSPGEFDFDRAERLVIAYPDVSAGSELVLKTSTTEKGVLKPHYGQIFTPGLTACAHWHLVLRSRQKLFLHINDPKGVFDVSTRKDKDGMEVLEVRLKKPIFEGLSQESDDAYIDWRQCSWIHVSTVKTFAELARLQAKQCADVDLSGKILPPLLEEIYQQAKAEKTFIDRVNKTTMLLAGKVRYLADMRTVKGRLCPRPLAKVAQTQVGDCKDMSAATVAILRKLGYKAQLALIWRGIEGPALQMGSPLPSLSIFNHQIVRVEDEKGRVFYIDPTNVASMAGLVFPDIADRPVLPQAEDTKYLERTPALDPMQNKFSSQSTLSFEKPGVHTYRGELTLENQQALCLTAAALYQPVQSLKETLARRLSDNPPPFQSEIKLPDLSSRLLRPITIGFFLRKNARPFSTNYGEGLSLFSHEYAENFLSIPLDTVAKKFIGVPYSSSSTLRVLSSKAAQPERASFSIQSPWIDVHVRYRTEGKDILATMEVVQKKSVIFPEEVSGPAFKNLRSELLALSKTLLILDK